MCMNRSREESSYEVLNPYSPRSQVEEVEVGGSEGNQVSATVPQSSAASSAQSSPESPAQLPAERGRQNGLIKKLNGLGYNKTMFKIEF